MRKNKQQKIIITLIAIVFAVSIYFAFYPLDKMKTTETSLTNIQTLYQDNKLKSINIKGNKISAITNSKEKLITYRLNTDSTRDLGFNTNPKVPITVESDSGDNIWKSILINVIPAIILFVIIMFIIKGGSKGGSNPFSFVQSRGRLHIKGKKSTTFDDIAGNEEAKEELLDIVDFLKSPRKYLKMGAKIPKGILLFGAPGVGKTLMARAIAGEANVPFFSISGSEFVEMFVGVGASRVRSLFTKAKKAAPAIIFIDEIDAVGRKRGTGVGGGNDEREQTLNQILTEMDGFEIDSNVIVCAATNRPDVLDSALLRPGRFDRRVMIDLPRQKDRVAILKIHARNKPMNKNIDYKTIARKTIGLTGADLGNIMNEAALISARQKKKTIAMEIINDAIEKIILGTETKSRILSDAERNITAYHETGHALVAHYLTHTDPVHKISIVSRGHALGVTWFLPNEDTHLVSRQKFMEELAVSLGGRTAEEIIFSEITTGASNDMQKATETARKMITEYGMSKTLGPISFSNNHNISFDQMGGSNKIYSEKTAQIIDTEVAKLITDAHKLANSILVKHKKELLKIAKLLLEQEIITDADLEKYIGKKNH